MSQHDRQTDEALSVACHLQQVGLGGLICKAADRGSSGRTTNEVTREVCLECEVGRIYREVGCDAVGGKMLFTPVLGPQRVAVRQLSVFCQRRRCETDIDYCRTCDLVVAPTTREIVTAARGLFEDEDFYSAYKDIEKAREAIRDGEYEDAITASLSCFESTMKVFHERLAEPLPTKEQVTGLWKSTRELIDLEGMDSSGALENLLNTLGGASSHLGGLRNELGDAHGKGLVPPLVTEAIAELALNSAATLSTFIVRCLKQLEAEEE